MRRIKGLSRTRYQQRALTLFQPGPRANKRSSREILRSVNGKLNGCERQRKPVPPA
jgi:hypothetical protein